MIELTDLNRWPSLANQLSVAEQLFGTQGQSFVHDWLAGEVGRINDPAFAKLFTDQVSLPGVADADYAHRHVRSAAGELIGGIRFYAQDTSRPFVEIVAHSFAGAALADEELDRLRDCVRSEWSMFAPLDLRLRVAPGGVGHPAARTDVTIHAARHRDMTQPDGRVQMPRFANVEEAIEIVRDRHAQIAAHAPDLAKNLSPADPDNMRAWHDANQLRSILAGAATVGLLAIAPGSVAWIEGDVVNEEVVVAAHGGQGYAASAQVAWAATVAQDRNRVLVGTIDRLNLASRRSAERAGRPAILEEIFLPLV
ncbi:hypothetical protein ABEB22_14295 (plasmid) [Thioclava sp. 'Guangxiensis']|uniref:hypothetical protein n=1 Tax=Thioclava sp. 'Guangxiensis' TaxID=3149044 RepID=UPI0032C49F41